ncbi:hypothetical protein [Streptomyces sp. NPDC021356]|uniref:hypothetical protein n=1 Tax=Streptomyces sp. NPDC021356 TaxID=3154900 RepID=UPI0033CC7888
MSTRATAHASWRRAALTLTATVTALAALSLPAAAAPDRHRQDSGHSIKVDGSQVFHRERGGRPALRVHRRHGRRLRLSRAARGEDARTLPAGRPGRPYQRPRDQDRLPLR